MRGIGILLAAAVAFSATTALAADEQAAKDFLKDNNCTKCHSVSKKKDGPPYKEVAAKLKGKPDAKTELFKHLTSKTMVKVDGKEEQHKMLDLKDEAAINNLIEWILSL